MFCKSRVKVFLIAVMVPVVTMLSYGQDTTMTLDGAIASSLEYLKDRIPAQSRVLLLNVASGVELRSKGASGGDELANYVVNELTAGLVNNSSFVVVDRRNLDMLQDELNFQLSGEVDDKTAVTVGNKLGAQSIISGALMQLGDMYRLQIKAIEVVTAQIQGIRNTNVINDALVTTLAKGKGSLAGEYANKSVTLDAAMRDFTNYLRGSVSIKAGSKLVVLDVEAVTPNLSTYIIETLSENIVNETSFTVVDRRQLDAVQQELRFQHSGEVSDESAQSIGKKLGAQHVVFGSITTLGDLYYLFFTALDVETAAVQGMQRYIVYTDAIMASLTGQSAWKIQVKDEDAAGSAALWKNKRLYLGVRPGMSLHVYDTAGGIYSEADANSALSLDIALQAAFQITTFFSVQAEAMITSDAMSVAQNKSAYDSFGVLMYSYKTKASFSSTSLILPVLAKCTFRPGKFSLAAFGGVYIAPGLGTTYQDSFNGTTESGGQNLAFGYAAGASGGYKLGPGVLFADIRYLGDFVNTSTPLVSGDLYKRGILAFSVGYEMGFLDRRTK